MYAAERYEHIVGRARTEGRVEVRDLARSLRVTPETVRRDLADLARRGVLRRVHGGAVPAAAGVRPVTDAAPGESLGAHRDRIARRALEESRGAGSIALAGGAGILDLARMLPDDAELTVVTPALPVAALLASRPHIDLHLLGGRVRAGTLAAVGDWIVRSLSEVAVDVAFLGADGLTVTRGLTTPDLAEATVQRGVMEVASRTVVLADRTALGHHAFAHVAPVSALDLVITDRTGPDGPARALAGAGTPVVRA